ncbi:uncharacterized protein LOC8059914 [Sorghum bicolor]|nr:uncharacterized protein LOC8059914 [Sorghum bicolor]|eukprot:XP_021310354.1 uncharacterized protein LOC8059914 [Sorghum bicolor]
MVRTMKRGAIMAGGNSTRDHCSYNALKQCSSRIICDGQSLSLFHKSIRHRLWLVNALLVASAILAGVIVGIGIFGQRYRYHRLTRFIFVGATTLFLPVMSTAVPLVAGSNYNVTDTDEGRLAARCDPEFQSPVVIVWASLVQIIMINTSAIVAVDDREGRNIGPPFDLLVQGLWTYYLGVTYFTNNSGINSRDGLITFVVLIIGLEGIPFALTCAKMVFKYYAFEKARQSFALGNNPHLIFAYMRQPPPVQARTSHRREAAAVTNEDAPPPPPLVVMGEGKRNMEKQSHGYVWKGDSGMAVHGKDGLVTIDSVWKMTACFFPFSTLQRLQDLCLSFAFFKLLRCRFAGYNVHTANASSDMFTFFWSLLLKEGDHNRVFRLISEEISFVHDYYYTSIPISYSKCWLPIVGIFISLLSITYCILAATWLSFLLAVNTSSPQLLCFISCTENQLQTQLDIRLYGSWLFGLVPLLFLLVLVFITEVRDMASYVCSNWTKVALVCRLLNRASSSSSKHSLCIQKCAGLLIRCRCKLLRRHWDEKIGQFSVLVLQPRATPLGLLWYLFPFLPDQNRKVSVPAVVKVCIMQALRRTRDDGGQLSNGAACLRRCRDLGESFNWACSNKSTSYTILTWHIATSILEVRYPNLNDEGQGSPPLSNTDYKMVATHLSRYCAYLVTWCPELLPDDHEWSRSLYENVKKDTRRVLAGCTAGDSLTQEVKCQQLVELLSTKAKHQVVKDGARLGEQLAKLVLHGGDDTAWKLLAEFWSEMVLYVAPSDNLKGHKEAIARGGELITLLWVLLFHAGIVSRPGENNSAAAAAAAATSAAGVV